MLQAKIPNQGIYFNKYPIIFKLRKLHIQHYKITVREIIQYINVPLSLSPRFDFRPFLFGFCFVHWSRPRNPNESTLSLPLFVLLEKEKYEEYGNWTHFYIANRQERFASILRAAAPHSVNNCQCPWSKCLCDCLSFNCEQLAIVWFMNMDTDLDPW